MESKEVKDMFLDETYCKEKKALETHFREFQEKYNEYIGGVQVSKLANTWSIQVITLGKSAVELLR